MLINLTPHQITLLSLDYHDGSEVVIAPSGKVARCEVETQKVGSVWGCGAHGFDVEIAVVRTTFGAVYTCDAGGNRLHDGLPSPGDITGKYHTFDGYVVSRAVAEALGPREDVFFPTDLVRDEEGRVVGARALARI